jgi:O-antigen ligase
MLVVSASIAVLLAVAFALGTAPMYGAAAIGGLVLLGILVLAPRMAFFLMLFALTGWPYYVGIDIGRDIPLPFVLFLIAAVWVLTLVRQGLRIEHAQARDAKVHNIDVSVAILFAVLVISILLSGQPEKGVQPLVRVAVLPIGIYMAARHFIRGPEAARLALDVLLVGAAIGGIYADYEWILGQNPLLEHFAPPQGDMAQHGYWTATQAAGGVTLYRSHGFGLNPIFFATTLSMLLIHAAVRFATATQQSTKTAFGVACLLALSGLVATFSRGPILACGGGLVICAWVYPSLRKYIALALAAAAGYAAYDLLREGSVLAERINDTDNITLRFKLWQTAFAMFTDHPVFGVGLGQFPEHQLDVIRRHQIGPFFEMGDGRLETVKTAEHGVLQFLAETGLVGGIGALTLAGAVALIYLPAMFGKEGGCDRPLAITAGTALIVFLLVGFTVTIYNSWEAGCLVPVMLATLCAARRGQSSNGATGRAAVPADARGRIATSQGRPLPPPGSEPEAVGPP